MRARARAHASGRQNSKRARLLAASSEGAGGSDSGGVQRGMSKRSGGGGGGGSGGGGGCGGFARARRLGNAFAYLRRPPPFTKRMRARACARNRQGHTHERGCEEQASTSKQPVCRRPNRRFSSAESPLVQEKCCVRQSSFKEVPCIFFFGLYTS